jgi:hypothetical protein
MITGTLLARRQAGRSDVRDKRLGLLIAAETWPVGTPMGDGKCC